MLSLLFAFVCMLTICVLLLVFFLSVCLLDEEMRVFEGRKGGLSDPFTPARGNTARVSDSTAGVVGSPPQTGPCAPLSAVQAATCRYANIFRLSIALVFCGSRLLLRWIRVLSHFSWLFAFCVAASVYMSSLDMLPCMTSILF